MTLEDLEVLRVKNKKRLRNILISTFCLGVNVTAPSRLKDSLRILSVIIIILSWTTCYGLVEYIIVHKDSILVIAESSSILLQTLISIFKLSYIICVQRRFYNVMKKVESHELVDEIHLLSTETQYNKQLRKDAIQILNNCWMVATRQFNYYIIAVFSIIGYYFFGAISINAYHTMKGHTNHTNILAFPVVFPAWEDKRNLFPYYQIMTIIVGTGDYIAGICALSFDGLFIMMAMHGVALFRILKKIILFTTSPDIPKDLRIDYVRQCISHFERTYRFCVDVNELYMQIGLLQFLLSLAILGIVMFEGALGLETDFTIFFKMTLYLSAAGFQVVLYCLNGQFITNESNSIPNAWYECNWYNESKEFQRLIRMMILRSNRVIYMRASWFSTMTLPTLLAIVKTSGSYFLLLRNLAFT